MFFAIYFSEHVKIFSGNGTLEYHKQGCCPNNPGSYVEIPFMRSNNIAVNILLTQLQSRITSHFVILKHGLHSGTKKCYLSLCFEFAVSLLFTSFIKIPLFDSIAGSKGLFFCLWCPFHRLVLHFMYEILQLCLRRSNHLFNFYSPLFTHLCNF